MTGDQVAGVIGIMMMLLVVIQRLMSQEIETRTLLRMALIWLVIIVGTVLAVSFLAPYLHLNLT